MIKIDLITGFLGSGKTTFIKKYARHLIDQGERVCILENDYGAINIDMVLLGDLLGPNCELEMVVGGDGHEAHQRRFRTKLINISMLGFTRVIVEPSGIYDVDEFFDTLYESPLDRWYEAGSVISIVDPWQTQDLSEELRYILMSETARAGKIVFSKLHNETNQTPEDFSEDNRSYTDSLRVNLKSDSSLSLLSFGKSVASNEITGSDNPASASDCTADISTSDPAADADLTAALDYLNASLLHFRCKRKLDLNRDILAKSWDELTEQDFSAIENAGYVNADHLKLALNDNNNFQSLFYLYYRTTETDIRERIRKLFSDPETGNVIRVKGFMKLQSEERSHELPLPETQGSLMIEKASSQAQDSFIDETPSSLTQGSFIEVNATRDAINISPIHETQEVIIVIGENLRKNVISGYFPGATTV